MIHALPALLFTIIGLFLRHASRDPKTARGDSIIMDFCLGLVVVGALVFWLRVFSSLVF